MGVFQQVGSRARRRTLHPRAVLQKRKRPQLGPFLFSKLFEHGCNVWRPRDATHQPARWRSEPISRVLSLDDHLSSAYVAAGLTLEQPERGPGRPMAFLFALSPDGVCQAAPLPTRWCALTAPFQLFSLGASPQRESSFLWHCPSGRHPALWSPDFPHRDAMASPARPSGPLRQEGSIYQREGQSPSRWRPRL